MQEFEIDEIRNWYQPTHRVLFITGAGISVDSGLPTYRGVAGLYESETTEDGIPIEMALSGDMFQRRPEITWKYLMQIADACRGKQHNRGHQLIAEMEKYFSEVWVLTQNIDGFHKDAGSSNVIEIHGTMRKLRCNSCDSVRAPRGWDEESIPPTCETCPAEMRPDVVLFGEMLPDAAVADYHEQLGKGFDAIFVVGTTAVFPYIASPIYMNAGTSCLTVEINPQDTDLSGTVDCKLDTGATEGLENIARILQQLQ